MTARRAFSLVEVLVAVGVLAVLLGLTLPAVQQARGTAARAACQNNMRQVGLALHQYHGERGRFPAWVPGSVWDAQKYPSVNWLAKILAQVGEEPLARATEAAVRTAPYCVFRNPPHVGLGTAIKVYLCPADTRFAEPTRDRDGITVATTGYVGAHGPGQGVLARYPGMRIGDIRDGASGTLLAGERPPPDTLQAGKWYTFLAYPYPQAYWEGQYGPDGLLYATGEWVYLGDPCRPPFPFGPGAGRNPCDRYHYWSVHAGGANFLFADGGVRFLRYGSHDTILALTSPQGGEVVSLD